MHDSNSYSDADPYANTHTKPNSYPNTKSYAHSCPYPYHRVVYGSSVRVYWSEHRLGLEYRECIRSHDQSEHRFGTVAWGSLDHADADHDLCSYGYEYRRRFGHSFDNGSSYRPMHHAAANADTISYPNTDTISDTKPDSLFVFEHLENGS